VVANSFACGILNWHDRRITPALMGREKLNKRKEEEVRLERKALEDEVRLQIETLLSPRANGIPTSQSVSSQSCTTSYHALRLDINLKLVISIAAPVRVFDPLYARTISMTVGQDLIENLVNLPALNNPELIKGLKASFIFVKEAANKVTASDGITT
jgi:hypothetical protein